MTAKELVEVLEQVAREDGVEQIVLAGGEVLIPVLRAALPKPLTERIVDVLRLDITAPEHHILKVTTDALREHGGETDADDVRHQLDQYCSGQLAATRTAQTLQEMA